ncbi:MAG: DoxX family protein [Hamadaea sp.]|uniref:DoxX family protein n=1 Tax=Hamadaea sp. TaxID=2024425 RepID=UPI0017EE0982|nr:DoxX family protein [Hamadaea sp.]NUR71420.1 DoxX family protein [Hamadaea sp.]NUT23730.1 DoxX family protein [Hamadaea sp.]
MTSQISADVLPVGTGQRRTRITANGVLWVLQALLGLFFAGSGFGKVLLLDDAWYTAAPQAVAWYAAVSQPLIVFIGVAEVLGGLGVLFPAMTRVRPSLTPLAAAGLTLTMILAGGFHVVRGEFDLLPYNIVLGAVAAVVAIGRWAKRPIAAAPLTRGRVILSAVVAVLLILLVFAPTWYSMTRF